MGKFAHQKKNYHGKIGMVYFIMNKVNFMESTNELLRQIQNYDIEEFKKDENFDKITITEYLNTLLEQHDLQAKDIIFKLNMERSYTYQILKGRRNPTRIFLIRLSILCGLSLDETQKMLSIGQRPILYPRNRFDAAIIYAIQNHLKEEELNQLLADIGEEPLV